MVRMISNLRISLVELVIWAVLAMAGLAWTLARVLDGLERARDWWTDRRDSRESGVPVSGFRRLREWTRDRVTPLLGPDEASGQEMSELCSGCWDDSEHCDGAYDTCNCTCAWPEDWAEQEQEEKVTTPPHHDWDPHCRTRGCQVHGNWTPSWEAEHRAAYEAMGFDYPSGLMARVRELTP